MINSKETKKKFNEYIQKYDLTNEMIRLKIAHMLRVMNINTYYATKLKLDKENIEIAAIIGLLHDIGRFVQIEKYNTFIDSKSINHSQAGVDLLFKENMIRFFVEDDKYDYIIEKAISNHGKFEIEDGLYDRALLHSKLIRDADKTDIFEVMLTEEQNTVFDGKYDPNASISPGALEDFYSKKIVNLNNRITIVDDYVRKVAFIYDLYFNFSLEYIKEKDYLNRMNTRFTNEFKFYNNETNLEIEKINKLGNDFLNNIR